MSASVVKGLDTSHTSPLILATNIFFASPSAIDLAISIDVIPSWYSLTAPSGNLILIILVVHLPFVKRSANLTKSCVPKRLIHDNLPPERELFQIINSC